MADTPPHIPAKACAKASSHSGAAGNSPVFYFTSSASVFFIVLTMCVRCSNDFRKKEKKKIGGVLKVKKKLRRKNEFPFPEQSKKR